MTPSYHRARVGRSGASWLTSGPWRRLAAFGLAFALGCERPATEVIVRIDSDIPWGVGQRVQSVVLEVRRGGSVGALRSRRVTAVGTGGGRLPLPLFVGVNETVDDTATPLWIEALACAQTAGCSRDGALSAQRAMVQFVPERSVELRLLLASTCAPSRCSLEQSCTPDGACVAASSAQATLRPIEVIPTDAVSAAQGSDATSDATQDAPAQTDATRTDGGPTDAAPGDATPMDAPPTDTARTDAASTDTAPPSDLSSTADASPTDRAEPADALTDSATSDVRPTDLGPADVSMLDAGSPDIARTDVSAPDVALTDISSSDAAPIDAGPMDARADSVTDVPPSDTGPTDTGPTDTGPTDTGPTDTGPTDTGPPLRCPTGMLAIPAGQFLMGSNTSSFEQPVHGVRMSAFCVDETEVTVAAYRACVGAGICAFPTSGTACNYPTAGRDEHPINCVTWNQAQTYCLWRGGTLPTESQWEYVARGPTSRLYPWGTEAPTSTLICAVPEGPAATSTCVVATHRGGDSPFGAADMAGNVWEWTLEDYAGYSGSATTFVMDPVGTMSGMNRSIRGGAFNATGVDIFRGAFRSLTDISNHRENIGFRCVHGPL